MGRSRGGLTTKIHALVDANGLPIALKLTEGQAHDTPPAMELVADIGAGQILLADRAYDTDALRDSLATRGAWANVKPKSNRTRTLAFSAFLYKERNLVERFFNKLKNFRAIATRYDKLAENYLAGVKLASARIWMRHNESVPWITLALGRTLYEPGDLASWLYFPENALLSVCASCEAAGGSKLTSSVLKAASV